MTGAVHPGAAVRSIWQLSRPMERPSLHLRVVREAVWPLIYSQVQGLFTLDCKTSSVFQPLVLPEARQDEVYLRAWDTGDCDRERAMLESEAWLWARFLNC